MRISDWSSDVCSSDLAVEAREHRDFRLLAAVENVDQLPGQDRPVDHRLRDEARAQPGADKRLRTHAPERREVGGADAFDECGRSEERRGGKESVRTCRYRW